jgi:hypothetical protein
MSLQALTPVTSVSWVFNATQNGFAKLLDKVRQIVVNRLATPGGIATVGSIALLVALARRCLRPVPKVNPENFLNENYREVFKSKQVDKGENAKIVVIAAEEGDKKLHETLIRAWNESGCPAKGMELEGFERVQEIKEERIGLITTLARGDVIATNGKKLIEANRVFKESLTAIFERIMAEESSTKIILILYGADTSSLTDQVFNEYPVAVITPKSAT